MKVYALLASIILRIVSAEVFTDENFKRSTKEYIADEAAGEAKYGHISTWDTSQVTKMDYLFCYADQFNQDISKWNVAKVTDMSGMFDNAKKFDQDISGWDVSSANNMYAMFTYASTFNQDLSSWQVSQVTDMTGMFWEALSFEQNLPWKLHPEVKKDWMMFGNNAKIVE